MKRLFFVFIMFLSLYGCSNKLQEYSESQLIEESNIVSTTKISSISTLTMLTTQNTSTTCTTFTSSVTKQIASLVCVISRDSISTSTTQINIDEDSNEETDDEMYEYNDEENIEFKEHFPEIETKPNNSNQIKSLERKIANCQSRIEGYESLKLNCNNYLFDSQQKLNDAIQDLENANAKLENAKEKTVKTYSSDKGWHYAPDAESVADAEYEVSRCQERVDSNTEYVNSWYEKIAEYDTKIQEKQNEIELLQNELESLQ